VAHHPRSEAGEAGYDGQQDDAGEDSQQEVEAQPAAEQAV
jgi:hypothetical protein